MVTGVRIRQARDHVSLMVPRRRFLLLVYLRLTKIISHWSGRTFAFAVAPFILVLPLAKREGQAMDAFLLIVAWGAGIASLFLIADMSAADFANRRSPW
jgi:hypothetical protein